MVVVLTFGEKMGDTICRHISKEKAEAVFDPCL
jgi:hypothetical protein